MQARLDTANIQQAIGQKKTDAVGFMNLIVNDLGGMFQTVGRSQPPAKS
jgi:hypothetical protein